MVSRSSPDLKSGASRPLLINPLHWEKSRLTSSGTRAQTGVCTTTGDDYANDTWWTDMPSCFFLRFCFLFVKGVFFKKKRIFSKGLYFSQGVVSF